MSKLLSALDRAIQTDFEGVNEAVMDKTYMGQLVAVQHQRGATGGQIFAEMLGLSTTGAKKGAPHAPPHLEPPRPSIMATQRPEIIIPPRSTAMIPPGHVKNTLLHLFDVGSPSRMTLKVGFSGFLGIRHCNVKYLHSEGDVFFKALYCNVWSIIHSNFLECYRGSFNCYVDTILSFFDYLPT